ncbi:MAG: thiamine pyrophosphate-dependent enzyme, partial [Ignavibacteria bacterium]|nr:thiamine pyrophosphate-dependent enzyme [Ignavibacteria bacterium]
MTEEDLKKLDILAFEARRKVIKMASMGGCYIGASLSCIDILAYLYSKFLNINPNNIKDEDRDYFLLSKGHAVPALYGIISELGFFDESRLLSHLRTDDFIYWHPNSNIPGVEFHSGSLGHILSVAMGIAYDCKLKDIENKIVIMLGDGELNEGSVWEGILAAASMKLHNLVIVIDRNHFQANTETEKLSALEPLDDKFRSFFYNVYRTDGHDFSKLHDVFTKVKKSKSRMNIIIADTVRGKGLTSIENRTDKWFVNISHLDAEKMLAELESGRNK